jgi:hypothetical protein
MGVMVEWYPRDPLVTVWIVKLVDGAFPPRAQRIDSQTPLHYFDLADVESICGPPGEGQERKLYDLPTEVTTERLAATLRECGSGLLRGDLTLLPALERRIRDRARDGTIARWGHEGARERGW